MNHLLSKVALAFALLSLLNQSSISASADELPVLEPLPVHPRAARFVVDQVRSNHLVRNIPLDDRASSEIFDRFLEILDKRKNFLLAEDIEEFENFRFQFDDDLKRGRLGNAFKMMNRLQQRQDDRYEWIIQRLKRGVLSFDLKTDGEIPVESDEIEWASNTTASDLRWENNLIDSIIHLKLNDRPLEEIEEVLTKRYTNRRNRNRQYTSEEAFGLFLNSFTHIYDPHTQYFSPRVAEDFHMSMRMSLEGIGALLGTEDEYVKVLEIVKGGPADQDGRLQPGDRILAVGQGEHGPLIDVVGRRLNDVVDLIRGPKETLVRLEIVQSLTLGIESQVIALTRGKIKIEETSAKKKRFSLNQGDIEHNIGVVELPKVYADLAGEQTNSRDYTSAARDVERLVEELVGEGIDGLILDLRNNGGGSLPEAHKLVGLFIDKGPTVQVKGLGKNRQVMQDLEPGVIYDGPLAVLVNRNSASASEIIAGAMQDYGRGLVVGTQTYGKGSVQTILNLNHGQLKITQAKYYRVSGKPTQHDGVVPDIEFPSLVDVESVGESSYENALIAETIKPAEYVAADSLSSVIHQLRATHSERIVNDPFFQYYQAVADRIQVNNAQTSVSLNEDKRESRLNANSAWRLHTENQYLLAFGEQPVESIDELNDALNELSDRLELEVDGMVLETGRILIDLAETRPQLAQANQSG